MGERREVYAGTRSRPLENRPARKPAEPAAPTRGHDPLADLSARPGSARLADAHATRISRATASQPARADQTLLRLQRQYGNRHVQRVLALARQGDGSGEVAPEVEHSIERARGGGHALDRKVRGQMESAFGADFGGVRVHDDTKADTLNRELNARAFTTGKDVFFRQGEYKPSSSGGRKLLAHELTHVVQQTLEVRRKMVASQAGDRFEREAEQAAQAITKLGQEPLTVASQATPPGVSRQEANTNGKETQFPTEQKTTTDKATAPIEDTPLEKAKKLLAEKPNTNQKYAKWVWKAFEQDFVKFNFSKENWKKLKDNEKVGKVDPAKDDMPILNIIFELVKAKIQPWVDGNGTGAKPTKTVGSFLTSGGKARSGRHGKGKAIDINDLGFTTSADEVIDTIADLPKGSYGLGFPPQGDFFDPKDELKKKKAEESKKDNPSAVTGWINQWSSIYKSTWKKIETEKKNPGDPKTATAPTASTKANAGKWTTTKDQPGKVHTLLQSDKLKTKLTEMKSGGYTLVIFPDNPNHLHIDKR